MSTLSGVVSAIDHYTAPTGGCFVPGLQIAVILPSSVSPHPGHSTPLFAAAWGTGVSADELYGEAIDRFVAASFVPPARALVLFSAHSDGLDGSVLHDNQLYPVFVDPVHCMSRRPDRLLPPALSAALYAFADQLMSRFVPPSIVVPDDVSSLLGGSSD